MTESCPHRPACDGCPLFEASAADAEAAKIGRIRRAFDNYERLAGLVPNAIVGVNDLGYRNRARMAIRAGKPGFYLAGTRDHLPIETCAVHEPELESMLRVVRRHLEAAPLRDAVEFIDARAGVDSVVTFVVSRRDDDVRGALMAVAAELPGWGVSVARGDATGSVLVETPETLSEPAAAVLRVGDLELEAPPRAFFQVNTIALESIHDTMRAWMGDESCVVDAYCGVGTHGLAIGSNRRIVGFDASADAVAAGARNAARNGLNAAFHHIEASDLSNWEWPKEGCVTVANPARAGLTPEFVDAVAESPTTRLLYLSCEPTTLARDIERLARRGFVVDAVRAFDMMPRTEHVETLVRLGRGDTPVRTYEAAFDDEKRWPRGVSGPLFDGGVDRTTWFARVVGKIPHGVPPQRHGRAVMEVRRLRNIGDQSVIRVSMQSGDVRQLRQRLRDWGHPVVGDPDYGFDSANALTARSEWLDRLALHCVRVVRGDQVFDAPVPPELLPILKLPGHRLLP